MPNSVFAEMEEVEWYAVAKSFSTICMRDGFSPAQMPERFEMRDEEVAT